MANKEKIELNAGKSDDWDDSVILSSFEVGIQSFRNKSSKPANSAAVSSSRSKSKGNSFEDSLAAYANKDSRGTNSRTDSKADEGNSKRAKTSSSSIFDACADKWEEQQRQASSTEEPITDSPQGGEQERQPLGEPSSSGTHQYPAFPPSTGNALQDEALQGLLMAWYYSGYATGRYQAMQEMGAFTSAAAETSVKMSAAEEAESGTDA